MAITIAKRRLSGSTEGLPLAISATAGVTPITIHTGITGTGVFEELHLYANNTYSQVVNLILEWGISTTTSHMITPVPSQDGLTIVVPGLVIQGSNTAPTVAGFVAMNGSGSFAASSGLVTVVGFVNRITQT